MKVYRLPQLVDTSQSGEYFLGCGGISASPVYIRYGRLRPKETGRVVTPPDGSEEIIYIIKGAVTARRAKSSFPLSSGEAFFLNCQFILDNSSDDEALYIIAGGNAHVTAVAEKQHDAQTVPSEPEPNPCAQPVEKEDNGSDFEITRDDGEAVKEGN